MLLLALGVQTPAPVLPENKRLVYVGRFDRRDPKAVVCQWSACEVRLTVDGPTLVATMEEKGTDDCEPVVDGRPSAQAPAGDAMDAYRPSAS